MRLRESRAAADRHRCYERRGKPHHSSARNDSTAASRDDRHEANERDHAIVTHALRPAAHQTPRQTTRSRIMRQAAAATTHAIQRRAARAAHATSAHAAIRMQASTTVAAVARAALPATVAASCMGHSSALSLAHPSAAASFSTAVAAPASPCSSSDARYAALLHTLLTINRDRKVRMGVETTRRLLEALGPHFDLGRSGIPVIHVAGSNGKGSVTLKIAAALQAHGLRVGVYTSPHLSSFRERIAINGQMISQEEMCTMLPPMLEAAARKDIPATFFELGTALAFGHFLRPQAPVDVAVLEVGLGGRLDSTNVLPKVELSVICSIALEHTEWLGDTIELIAREKAGILKPGCPALIGPSVPLGVVEQVGSEVGAGPIEQMRPAEPFLDYDDENSALATRAVHLLARDSAAIRTLLANSAHKGLNSALVAHAVKIRPPCRFQRVRWDPIEKRGHYIDEGNELTGTVEPASASSASSFSRTPAPASLSDSSAIEVVLDVCHNPAAFERLFEKLQRHYGRRAAARLAESETQTAASASAPAAPLLPSVAAFASLAGSSFPLDVRAVVGFSSDKDYLSCLSMLMARCSSVFVVQGDTPRAATVESVMRRAAEAGLQGRFPHCTLSVWSPSPAATLLHVLESATAAVSARASPLPPPPVVLCAGTFFIMSDVRAALALPHPTDPVHINEQSLAPNATADGTMDARATSRG